MYITRVEIQNIRSIGHLVWEIDAGQAAGWHVILGDNGSGKSTFVRATVLASLGVALSRKLEHFIGNWLDDNKAEYYPKQKQTVSFGSIGCDLFFDNYYDKTNFSSGFSRIQLGKVVGQKAYIGLGEGYPETLISNVTSELSNRFFMASYGPFRRFTGANLEENDLFEQNPVLRRHRTTFSERLALPDALTWLTQMQFRALENDGLAKQCIIDVSHFINQDNFLPQNTRLERITSAGVEFTDGNGVKVDVEELSDGNRSILSLTLELLRQLTLTFGYGIFSSRTDEKLVTVEVPGVVLIDEIDAHLHPTWQKQIGIWLTKHFPNIQFIVTTHSPLVCQAAERGTIFRLPTPGTDEKGRMLEGDERNRLLYGNILDAYSTQAFGYGITRSEVSERKLNRLADLNIKQMMQGLTPEEIIEQNELRDMLPSSASILHNGKSV